MSTGRLWAYVGVALGGGVSISANIAHTFVAYPSPAPLAVAMSIFWPVALFVAVEILARTAWPAGLRWVLLRFGGLVPVALVAAVVSYRHLSGLLAHYGEDPITVAFGPLAVDGLMLVATGALLATGKVRQAAELLPEPVVPVQPEPVVVEREPVAEPVRRRVTARSLTAAERVVAAHERHPDATHERLAELAKVSVSTVKRHRPERAVTGSPSEPTPAETAPVERVNGRVPELVEVTL